MSKLSMKSSHLGCYHAQGSRRSSAVALSTRMYWMYWMDRISRMYRTCRMYRMDKMY